MDFGIAGKTALVAAASEGIGLAIAQALDKEGVRVSLFSRSQAKLDRARATLKNPSLTHAGDITKEADLKAWIASTAATLGAPEILVTNTGGPPAGTAIETEDAAWQLGVESTLLNVVRLTREAVPHMRRAGFGRIVHLTSLVAKDPVALLAISSTLRGGLRALTKLQAQELGSHGITVNAVLPGHTLTARQTHLAEVESARSGASVSEILKQRAAHVPLKRLAEPNEIASVVAFLCSAQASYVSGESVLVDGGVSRGF